MYAGIMIGILIGMCLVFIIIGIREKNLKRKIRKINNYLEENI